MKKKKILVIENDEDILHIVDHILQDAGYHVIPSRTEEGMVKKIITEKPDIILLDIIKPTPAGTALCDAIKQTEGVKHIPVIVLSTYPQVKSVKIKCADEVIAKPFDVDDLLQSINEHLPAAGTAVH